MIILACICLCEIHSTSAYYMIHTSSSAVELNENGSALLELVLQHGDRSCIFKVKSNLQDSVEAKPSHGIITPQRNQALIHIRYKGKLTEMERAKLKIYWLPIPSSDNILTSKSIEIGQLYNKYRQLLTEKDEKHLTLPFSFKLSPNESSIQEFRFSSKSQSKRTSNFTNNKIEKQSNPFSNVSEKSDPSSLNNQLSLSYNTQQTTSISICSLIWLVLLAYLLGMTFGIKLARSYPQYSFAC